MIILDVNVLVAVHRADHRHHDVVGDWFDRLIAEGEPFGVPGFVWASFVRISTNRKIFRVPTSLADAFEFVNAVRGQPNHIPLEPGKSHLALFERLCLDTETVGELVPDAYLAAFAMEHGCSLASLDRDFARFPALSWVRPGD